MRFGQHLLRYAPEHDPAEKRMSLCTDEYKVVRPLDTEYTQAQMANTQEDTQAILDDPYLWLCGYEQYGGDECVVPQP